MYNQFGRIFFLRVVAMTVRTNVKNVNSTDAGTTCEPMPECVSSASHIIAQSSPVAFAFYFLVMGMMSSSTKPSTNAMI